MPLNKLWKGDLCTVWELKQKPFILFDLSWEHALVGTQMFYSLHVSMNDHNNAAGTDFEVRSKSSMKLHKYGICEQWGWIAYLCAYISVAEDFLKVEYLKANYLGCFPICPTALDLLPVLSLRQIKILT